MAITISGSGITSANIADDTIVNSDINSSAAIAQSKTASLVGGDLPTGSVLQVVNHIEGSSFSTTSTSLVDTNLTANITPSSTSSKVYVLVNAQLSGSNTTYVYGQMTVTRTPSGGSTTTISDNPRIDLYSQYNHHVYSIGILDSPGDAGVITYKVKVRTSNASQQIDCPHYLNDCSITLMEIAG